MAPRATTGQDITNLEAAGFTPGQISSAGISPGARPTMAGRTHFLDEPELDAGEIHAPDDLGTTKI